MKKINTLSLFDGISVGKVALDNLGYTGRYFACEIDKNATKISGLNHTGITRLGDVKGVYFKKCLSYNNGIHVSLCHIEKIDLLLGGSPCQGFSRAGKELNFDDPRSKLFFEYVRLLKETKPKYFLLENVEMKPEFVDIISKELGVQPIRINSRYFTAQSRPRLYWTNIPVDIRQIIYHYNYDINIKDILEKDPGDKYLISEKLYNSVVLGEHKEINRLKIRSASRYGYTLGGPGDIVDVSFPNSDTKRGRVKDGYSGCLTTEIHQSVIQDDLSIRYLTELECERLQGLPDGYTNYVSSRARYFALGNSFTTRPIEFILSFMDKNKKVLGPKTLFG